MRRAVILIACFLVVIGLSACKKPNQAPAPAPKPGSKKLTIAVIPKGTTAEFWRTVHAGAVKAGQELEVEVIWKGPIKEDDREQQIKVVEDFISRGVSGMVLAPLDDTALRVPVSNAVRAGIPVVVFDSALKSEDYTSFVATDNYRGGQIAGKYMVKLLNGKGKVFLLRYQIGSASTSEREQGFLDTLKQSPGIEVVSSNQYGGVTTETSYQASENVLTSFKNKNNSLGIDGIFCPNESTTFGTLRALQEGGWAGKVKFIGFDASAKLVDAMRNKQIDALIMQNPMMIGYLGVKTLVDHIRGTQVSKRVDTGVTLATPENMDYPEVKELLSPDLKKWLKE
jgi:ribose transport system substrate-binding protein